MNTKEIVKVEFVPHFYGGVNFSFWRVVGKDFQKTGNFKDKSEAVQWAIDNNYQVEDNQ